MKIVLASDFHMAFFCLSGHTGLTCCNKHRSGCLVVIMFVACEIRRKGNVNHANFIDQS